MWWNTDGTRDGDVRSTFEVSLVRRVLLSLFCVCAAMGDTAMRCILSLGLSSRFRTPCNSFL